MLRRYRMGYKRWVWKTMKSRWPVLAESEIKAVIKSAAARERNKSHRTRVRHRSIRLAAVAFYRRKFGDAEFLKQYELPKLPPLKRMWLPGGYAWWKIRGTEGRGLTDAPTPTRATAARAGEAGR
jgi:hypothetical protein